MRKQFNTIVFQTIITGLLGFSLIIVGVTQLRQAITKQQETQAFVDYATLQRAEVFRLTELARRLNDAPDDTTREAIIRQIQTGIAEFDDRQNAFRHGDPSANIVPAESEFILPILDNLDFQWTEYKNLLLDILVQPDRVDLVDTASNHATFVFIQADRLARTANNDLASTQEQTQRTFTIIAVMAAIVLVVFAVLFYRILGGLGRLQSTANEFAHGNYDVRAPETTYGELANVGAVLNQMASAVLKREQDLRNINETLEQRVQERTIELEQATREAQEAVHLKDEFLSVMSHELRTPLNAIMGYQGLLLMVGNLEGEDELRVTRTLANADHLLGLINNILDVSRLESQRMSYYPVDVEVRSFVEKMKMQFELTSAEKNLEFIVNIDTNVPTAIRVDEDVLTKIFNNLLSNAFKFTSEGTISLLVGYEEPCLLITVQDTGIGIPSHMQETVFEKFRQVDASTKRKYGGSGLGLSIIQNMVRELAGTISLVSEVDKGTEFKVALPVEVVAIKS